MVTLTAWLFSGGPTPAFAADDDRGGPGDQFRRLEQRLDELAERQEQLMRRAGARAERQEQPMRPVGPLPDRQGPMPRSGPGDVRQPMPAAGPFAPAAVNALHGLGDMARLILLAGMLCNILLTVWIYTDIRKRGEGSGIFVALALVAGIPAAIIYALVRIGDKRSLPPA
jgi:hypothetical protein